MNVNGFFASRHQGLIKVAEVTDTAAWDKDFGRVYVYVGEHECMRLQHCFVLLVLSLSEQLSNLHPAPPKKIHQHSNWAKY